jgi:hypothetical protein
MYEHQNYLKTSTNRPRNGLGLSLLLLSSCFGGLKQIKIILGRLSTIGITDLLDIKRANVYHFDAVGAQRK